MQKTIPEISVQELEKLRKDKIDHFILDVRNKDEYQICNLSGYLLPMNELPQRFVELNKESYIIVHCHAGGRSRRAVEFLQQQGFQKVFNLRGGITAWANEIDPSMPKY